LTRALTDFLALRRSTSLYRLGSGRTSARTFEPLAQQHPSGEVVGAQEDLPYGDRADAPALEAALQQRRRGEEGRPRAEGAGVDHEAFGPQEGDDPVEERRHVEHHDQVEPFLVFEARDVGDQEPDRSDRPPSPAPPFLQRCLCRRPRRPGSDRPARGRRHPSRSRCLGCGRGWPPGDRARPRAAPGIRASRIGRVRPSRPRPSRRTSARGR
jgi:hypothetical protein